ncbi:MAG: SurA N-terminal domain-containing protein, partial [Proteobacteria bacterium]|nr:SurA N-terminal domain-containing protein [Pseudomonadota bacterium]
MLEKLKTAIGAHAAITGRVRMVCAASLAASLLAPGVLAQGIPGLVVSTPGPTQGSPPPGAGMPGVFVAPSGPGPMSAPGMAVAPSQRAPAPAPKKKAASKPSAKPNHQHAAAEHSPAGPSKTAIVALVNDEPITGYEVDSRAKFMSLSTNIGDRAREQMKRFAQDPKINDRLKAILQETIAANQGKTREQVIAAFEERKKQFVLGLQRQAVEGARASVIPTMRKQALEELIEERLKFQEGKKLTIKVADSDVDKIFADMAKRNKMTAAEFAAHVKAQGADPSVIKSRLKASLTWREVVKKRYGHYISVSQRDVEELAAKAGGEATQELRLQLITLTAPGAVDQRAMAARYSEASAMRSQFKGCDSMASLAKSRENVSFQDLGFKKVSAISDPTTRSLLLIAK